MEGGGGSQEAGTITLQEIPEEQLKADI